MSRGGSLISSNFRVAIVHDWLLGMRGGERVLEQIIRLFPNCEIFTLFYRAEAVTSVIRERPVHAASVSQWVGVRRYYRYLLPFYNWSMKELSLKLLQRHQEEAFDLVISVSHCVAKNIDSPDGVPHICYCLTPMRYIWDQYDSYFRGRMIEPLVRIFVNRLRQADLAGTTRLAALAVISDFVQQRVERVWGLPSTVIYPPVSTDWIQGENQQPNNRYPVRKGLGDVSAPFLCVSALVPYKRVDVIVEAFNGLDLPLVIIGKGPEEERLKALATNRRISFVSQLSDTELASYYLRARAFVFAAEEDFGMAPVEAQAAGLPVIAVGLGGCRETVKSTGLNKTGVLVSEQTARALRAAVYRFLDQEMEFTVESCLQQANQFSVRRFAEGFAGLVQQVIAVEPIDELREQQC